MDSIRKLANGFAFFASCSLVFFFFSNFILERRFLYSSVLLGFSPFAVSSFLPMLLQKANYSNQPHFNISLLLLHCRWPSQSFLSITRNLLPTKPRRSKKWGSMIERKRRTIDEMRENKSGLIAGE